MLQTQDNGWELHNPQGFATHMFPVARQRSNRLYGAISRR